MHLDFLFNYQYISYAEWLKLKKSYQIIKNSKSINDPKELNKVANTDGED